MPKLFFEYEVDASKIDEFNRLSDEINASLEQYEEQFTKVNQARRDSERRTTRQLSQENKKQTQAVRSAQREQQQLYRETAFAVYGLSRAFRSAELTLGRATSEFIRQAAGLETYRATLQTVTKDAAETESVLNRLLKLTVDLVGIDTQDLIAYASRLMAVGLSADVVIPAIEGVTKRVAEQGKSALTTVRVLEQFSQAINTDIISYKDFIPILRQVPTLYDDFSASLGTTIMNLDDLRAASDAVGGPRAAIVQTLQYMARAARGADLDTLNAQLDIFHDSSRVLSAELGQHLIPAVVFLFREVNAGIQWFRGLSDEAQAAIAWSAALGTGFTALVATVGSVSAAIAFLNANLIATTGVGGLGGLGALLAPAGPIVAGFGLATAAISPFVALLIKSRVEMDNANRSSREFARQISDTVNAVGNTAAIDKQIASLQSYIEAQRQVIRQNEVTAETFRGSPSRARAGFVSRSGQTADTARQRVSIAERQIELLGRLSNLQDASVDDLREIDALLAQLLRDARSAEQGQVVRDLQAAAESVVNAFNQIESGSVKVFSNVTPLRNFSKELVQLRNAAENAVGLEQSIAAARELGRVQLEQIDAEIQNAARPFIERQKLSDEERHRVIVDLQALSAERLRVENETTAAVQRAYQADYQNWREIQDNRIAILQQVRELEVQGFRDAASQGSQLATELERIANPQLRSAFFEVSASFTAQGHSLDFALGRARDYVAFLQQINAIPDIASPEGQLPRGIENVGLQFEKATERAYPFLDALREIARLAGGAGLEQSIGDVVGRQERQDFQIQSQAVDSLGNLRRQAAIDAADFFRTQQQQEVKELQRSLRDQQQLYRQFSNQVAGVFVGLITGRINSFEDAAKAFISASVRIVARAFIEHQIQITLDNQLTAAKIANIQKVEAAQSASLLARGGLGNLSGFAHLFSGGGLALGAASLLFPEQIRNLSGGIADTISGFVGNLDQQQVVVQANIQNHLRIGDNEAREISDLTAEMQQEGRA